MALSVAVQEVMFILELMRSIKISIKLPFMVGVDNVGNIFVDSNITSMS